MINIFKRTYFDKPYKIRTLFDFIKYDYPLRYDIRRRFEVQIKSHWWSMWKTQAIFYKEEDLIEYYLNI